MHRGRNDDVQLVWWGYDWFMYVCVAAVKKDRDRFSKKISKLKATLKKVIKNYIEVSTIAPMGVAYRLEEDEDALLKSLMEGVYPWTEARAARHHSGESFRCPCVPAGRSTSLP
jgi:hypothetical protein